MGILAGLLACGAGGGGGGGDGAPATPALTCSVTVAAADLQTAIAAAADGTVICVQAGTYVGQVDLLGKSLTIAGAGSAQTTIDASAGSGYAVKSFGDNVRIIGVTLIGTGAGSSSFGFKVSGVDNVRLEDIAVQSSYRTAIDLHGVNGASLKQVVARDTVNGFGIMVLDSSNITLDGIETSGNAWGGVSVQSAGFSYPPGGSHTVTFLGEFTFTEPVGLLLEQDPNPATVGAYAPIAGVQVPAKFTHYVSAVRNPATENYRQLTYYSTLADANAAKDGLKASGNPVYVNVSAAAVTGTQAMP